MSLSGGSAAVNIQEIDLSTRVPGFPGVYGAILIPARKGPIDQPRLITSETQLLQTFTPLEKIEVGDSLAFFSASAFLQRSDKLWVMRVIGNNYKFGGLAIRQIDGGSNIAWASGESDPTAYTFGNDDLFTLYQADPGDWSDDICVKVWVERVREAVTLNSTNIVNAPATSASGVLDGELTITVAAGSANNGKVINLVDGAAAAGAETVNVAGNIVTVTIKDGASTQANICSALLLNALFVSAVAAHPTNTWTLGVGTDTVTLSGGTDASSTIATTQQFVSGEPVRFALLTNNTGDALPGGLDAMNTFYTVASSATTVKVATSLANALAGKAIVFSDVGQGNMQIVPVKTISEAGAFQIEVFHRSNLNQALETWQCSLTPGAKNGYGQNMFLEDILAGSNYIRASVNPLNTGSVLPQVVPLYMAGGDNGDPITDGKMILAADTFRNSETYPMTCFMDGGWATPAFQKYIDGIAQNRHDCVCFLSTPYDKEASANYLNDIVDYWMNILNLSSSHSALYTPHVKIYDKFNDRSLYVSPDGYAGAALSYTALNYEMWFPVAGFRRGQLQVLDLRRKFSKGEMDYLYDGAVSGGGGINPIKFASGRGVCLWGNKTLLGRPSHMSRLSTRLLLCVIEPAIAKYLEDFEFEINDAATRAQVSGGIISYLSGVQARRGIFDFKVICDETNNTPNDIDSYIMNVTILLKPALPVEYINLKMVITRTSMSFEDAALAV